MHALFEFEVIHSPDMLSGRRGRELCEVSEDIEDQSG